ncbi:MAG TPA: tetratricopeptide repeat protein, partial [Saprospiraceae bacterium]|nr:tetratricopeptide repeat protein [Saprospiraceae bacterium]
VHNELGILYRQLRQYDKCEEHLRKAQELAPSWGLPFANLAAVLTGLDRLDEAQVLIDKALILLPEYSNAHLTQGMIHEKQGRFLHAEAEYLRCTQLAPNHFAGFELLGYLYQKTAEFVMANENFVIADYLKNNLPLTPTDTDMDGIFDLLDLNNFQDGFRSEEELLALIEQDPDNPDLYYELGQVYSADRRYALAVPRFRKTAELDANYPMVYDHLAWAYFRLDQPELADQSIRLAKEKEDALEGREMFLAMIAESWERWEEAESIYHELLVQDSSEMILYQKLGALYERSGRFPEAEETYLRLKETNAYSSLDILYQFYLRMMDRMPGQAAWIIRPANLLYQVCLNSEKNYVIREDRFEDTFDDPDPSEKLDMVTDYYYSWSTHKEVNKHPDLRYWPQVCERPLSLLDLAFPYLVLARERGDARQKQGDIYLHLEDRDQAEARFEQALSYVPTEEGLRDKIVGSYLARHQLPAARRHLAHQDSVGHLRFPDHLLLARMNTLDNRFVSATAVLDEASGFFLDRNQQIRLDDLRAQRALLAGDLEAALRQYEANHQAWPRTGEDAYAIARIYAKNRNENQAFRWLDKALDQGFGQYTWVLARDPWMDGLRQSPKWQEAVKL